MSDRRFHHALVPYAGGDHGFLDGTLRHVRRALERDAGVLVAVGTQRAAALSEELGDDAGRVRFLDIRELGRNPARMIALWREFTREHARVAGGGALGIGEPVWPGRGAAELAECERHEALLNVAFDDDPAWRLLCAYDLDGLADEVIEAACRTHPLVARRGESRESRAYAAAAELAPPFAGELPPPRAKAGELAFGTGDLARVRCELGLWATLHGLGAARCEELVLAVDELAANSIRHGGGAGTLRFWREGATLLCEVRDHGWIRAPLVGRVRPALAARASRGVWLVNQLCDLVQIRSGPDGSVVRVHMRVP